MIKPILTEKSVNMSKKGEYSFWVDRSATKSTLKATISEIFGVEVVSIRTLNTSSEARRNVKGLKFQKMGAKKAVVTLKKGQKIDIYEKTQKNS